MINEKDRSKLKNVMVKLSQLYNECYIIEYGYTLPISRENCYLVMLDKETIDLFKMICGEFKILYIPSIKDLKTDLVPAKPKKDEENPIILTEEQIINNIKNDINIITDEKIFNQVISVIEEHTKIINSIDSWSNFILSDNNEENEEMLKNIFKENKYVDFKPSNKDYPSIILGKNLLPLISEKNYTDVFYSVKKINTNLFLLIIDFQFDLFRVYMFYFYIPIDNK